MKFEKHEISTIHKMIDRFQEMKKDLDEMSEEKRLYILRLHEVEYTLQHCLRWGETALYELLEELDREEMK